MSTAWLPPLMLLEDRDGNWEAYLDGLYGCFERDFLKSTPTFTGKRVALKRHPVEKDKEATFWHFISEGTVEADREIDLRRCERIQWPRPLMNAYPGVQADAECPIIWWKNQRGSEWRFVISVRDFSYVLVVADRGDYVLPWTAYTVERLKQRAKLEREFRHYWNL